MVLEIRLSNFFSIKDEIVLDLRAGNSKTQKANALPDNTFTRNGEQILKSVAIYGANASGKSNIIKAIHSCVTLILQSHTYNDNIRFDYTPFKFDGYLTISKPSSFFIRFVMDEIEYAYSFSFNLIQIISESLYYYPNGRKAKIFTRNKESNKKGYKYSFSSSIRKPMDVAENTSKKTLYLSRASQFDRETPQKIFRFFAENIVFGFHREPSLIENLYHNYQDTLLKALQIADSDIVNIRLLETPDPSQLLTFLTYHKADPSFAFDLTKEESAGTLMLFYIVLTAIDVVKNNKLLIIDEIDRSLHTKIVEYLLHLFHVGDTAQIIYTTHNTNLLNLEKLRKDQIYFVNKKEDASSDLYSLFDYRDFGNTTDVEKAYLQGRFDAIPYINDSDNNLKSLIYE